MAALALVSLPAASTAAASNGEAVVLLHGLGRSERAMRPLGDDLTRAGYAVCNVGYPSRSDPPEALVAEIAAKIQACNVGSAKRLHFVGHSLGGILTRAYLAGTRPENLGRVVMLAPPNRGSQLAAGLTGNAVFRWYYGPAGAELADGAHWPAPPGAFAVIAGNPCEPSSAATARVRPTTPCLDAT